MTVDAEPRTQIKHVKTRGGPEQKEYWSEVRVSAIHGGGTPAEPECPLPPLGAEGATKDKPLHKPHDVGYQHWQDEDS